MKKAAIITISVLATASIVFFILYLRPTNCSYTALNNTSYNAPNKVYFKYYLNNIKQGDLKIRYYNNAQLNEINIEDTLVSHLYNNYIYTNASFILKGKKVAVFPIHIKTNKWKASVLKDSIQNYLNIDMGSRCLKIDSFPNMVKDFRFIENIPVSGDSMTLRYRLHSSNDNINNKLIVQCKNGNVTAYFSSNPDKNKTKILNSDCKGKFKLLPQKKNLISIQTNKNIVYIGTNTEPLQSFYYKSKLGPVKGIILQTYKIDSISNVELKMPEQNCNYLPY